MEQLISNTEFEKALKLKKLNLKIVVPALMKVLKFNKVNNVYSKKNTLNGVDFIDDILKSLNINFHINESDFKNIPTQGSFIAIANHPYGGIDGLILLSLLAKKRPDIKILANFLLKKIEPIQDFIIPVNPFDNANTKQINATAVKQLLNHVKESPLAIFPAGEVSSLNLNNLKITDKTWNPTVAKLIKKAQVPVVPIYFSGSNSIAFNLLGLINPELRTLKLPSELFNKTKTIKIRIGKPIKYGKLTNYNTVDLLNYLRAKTYVLGESIKKSSVFKSIKPLKKPKTIIDAINIDKLKLEIDFLKENNKLLYSYNQYEVFISNAYLIPYILKEIGRLREITFRAIGEGTNRKIDLDDFDNFYKHLFVWDKNNNALVGAYRIGEGDVIFKAFGVKGFYIRQLFKIKKRFYPILYNSLELGRSFITEDYQRKPLSLMLLWKGIHNYLQLNDHRFKYLIGPVSISNQYNALSKELLVSFFNQKIKNNRLSNWVQPKKPFKITSKFKNKEFLNPQNEINLKELDSLIAEIEGNNNKLPVLLKKYIALNGEILAFNIDKKFNNALDGFLYVEINKIPQDAFNLVKA